MSTVIGGLPADGLESISVDVLEELRARSYIREPRVRLDSATNCIVVEVDEELVTGSTEEADLAVYDDLSDVMCGLLPLEQDFEMDVVDVRPSAAHRAVD